MGLIYKLNLKGWLDYETEIYEVYCLPIGNNIVVANGFSIKGIWYNRYCRLNGIF